MRPLTPVAWLVADRSPMYESLTTVDSICLAAIEKAHFAKAKRAGSSLASFC